MKPKDLIKQAEKEIKELKIMETGQVGDFPMDEQNKKEIQKLFKKSFAQRRLWECEAKLQAYKEMRDAIIEEIERKFFDSQQYADLLLNETEALSTSTISFEEAQKIADGYGRILKELKQEIIEKEVKNVNN